MMTDHPVDGYTRVEDMRERRAAMVGLTLDRYREVAELRGRDLMHEAEAWRLVRPVGRKWSRGFLNWLGRQMVELGHELIDRYTEDRRPIEMQWER
jgi:hypothetical protein